VRIKALIFDVDGTLADTEQAHLTAFNRAFEQHGLPWRWTEQEYACWLRITGGKERLAAFFESVPANALARRALAESVPAIHRTKTECYAQLIAAGGVPLRAGVARLIAEARSAGVRLAIASTTTRENIDALLAAQLDARTRACFVAIGAGDQVRRKKPAADIYEYVLREPGESPEECLAIEDSAHGLTAAKAAGLFTVVTPSRWTRGENFSAADLVLSSLDSCEAPLIELEYAFTTNRRWGYRLRPTAVGEA
jgi:HAD superfamily hydrolase (TIGR01509 family)